MVGREVPDVIDCYKSPSGDWKQDMKTLADRLNWGGIGLKTINFIVQPPKDGPWDKVDWMFNMMVVDEWGDYFKDPMYGYVNTWVEPKQFTDYLGGLASREGKGDDILWAYT